MATNSTKRLKYGDYHVAIICPLEVEMSAVRYMLNEEHGRLPKKEGDSNLYILGQMSGHNVAIAFLPQGSQGIGAAATVATDMKRTFLSIKLRLLVGIGGGIPSEKHHIRLGDVVVSMPDGTHGGVVQYDLGKVTTDGFERKGFLCQPPVEWRTAVVFLLDHGANIDDTNLFGRTALHLACYYHRKDVVELLLKRSANVNAQDKLGYNCVHILAQRFNEPIFRLLVDYGIDLRQGDRPGRTPLWLGLYDDQADFISALIQAGVVPTDSDCNRAAFEGAHESMKHLRMSIDLESKTTEAAWVTLVNIVPNDDMETFLGILEKGTPLSSRDWVENTVLHEACERNALSIFKFCLEKGLDPNVTNARKITPLHLAAKRSSHKAITLLLAAGANVNAKEAGGNTALHLVSTNGDEIGAAMLLDQAAILEARNSIEQTPLICASIYGKFDMVNFLIAKGADVKAIDATGGSVLFVPIMDGMTDLVRDLLERGANPNARSLETDFTLLELAIVTKQLEVAKVLLEKGADIDSRGELGKRPIHRAISHHHREMVEWLVAQGANIHILDDKGLTVLHWVAFRPRSEDDVEIARLFIEKGVDGTVKDSLRDMTALEYAQQGKEDDFGMAALLASAFPPPEKEEAED